jgi:hypothetical protein
MGWDGGEPIRGITGTTGWQQGLRILDVSEQRVDLRPGHDERVDSAAGNVYEKVPQI